MPNMTVVLENTSQCNVEILVVKTMVIPSKNVFGGDVLSEGTDSSTKVNGGFGKFG